MNCTIDASIFVAAARSVEPNHIPSRNFLQNIVEDFPGINLVSLDLPLAHRAAQIAVSYRLRGADAVYVAVAEAFNATLFSWDLEMLRRCPEVVETLSPAQWLNEESL